MKRLPFLLVALTVVLACSDTATQPIDLEPSFGFEPTPFYPSATNALDAVVHHLEVVEDQVESLCHPPDPCLPDDYKPGDVHPVIGKLGAMANELNALDERVKAVLGVEPEPFLPGYDDLKAAAVAVHGGAANVLISAREARMGFEPSPFQPAFDEVEGGALAIQQSVISSPFCQSAAGLNICLPDVLPGY